MKTSIILMAAALLSAVATPVRAVEWHVASNGADTNPGTREKPFATFAAAQKAARQQKGIVWFHSGTYYLSAPIYLDAADNGITYAAAPGETVVISGGIKLDLKWEKYRDGIFQARLPSGMVMDQLFVNGRRQPMARYPNYDASVRPYGGYAADAISKERAARWADPAGGYIHAMHRLHWGGYHYRITGKNDKGEITYEGGWQNNRQMGMHPQHRYVENIFEELDAPGEWFYNTKTGSLYYYPPENVDLKTATIEAVRLPNLIEVNGAKNITLRGFIFRHAARTFMDTKEPLLRSDWTIYRGGALLFQRSEDCTVEDCDFDQLGGNAIFVNKYNRRLRIAGCDIRDTGASAVAFVGDPQAVRSPLFEYNQHLAYADIDQTPGPKTDNYPADCVVEDCLIRGIGVIEKQAAGVQISMSQGITVRHCSIYDASRAGINIGDGCWGGHIIEFCDVFDTVKETSDHGSFNSWGRDRYWGLRNVPADELPRLALLDAVKPNVLRNNRWRCDHGWDVDLDDGSSNYEIYNNLFLNNGLKLREGFHRRVYNNIAVNNTLHPHVWFDNSGDIVTNNIWMAAYKPAGRMPNGRWGREIDRNLFTTESDRTKFAGHGCDAHSITSDPMFVNPVAGDYRVRAGSPAQKLGFQNFPMDQFGVQRERLKKLARTPDLPAIRARTAAGVGTPVAQMAPIAHYWQGARVKELEGEEFSAFGVGKEEGGIHVLEGVVGDIRAGDLIQSINGQPVKTFADLLRVQNAAAGQPLTVGIVRSQQPKTIQLADYVYVTILAAPMTSNGVPITSISTEPATRNESVTVLTDGRLAKNYGPIFPNGVARGRYRVDLGRIVQIAEIRTWSHNLVGRRGAQNFILYGGIKPDELRSIAEVQAKPNGEFLGTSVRCKSGLGSYRWLVWETLPVTELGEHTAFQEFQVLSR